MSHFSSGTVLLLFHKKLWSREAVEATQRESKGGSPRDTFYVDSPIRYSLGADSIVVVTCGIFVLFVSTNPSVEKSTKRFYIWY